MRRGVAPPSWLKIKPTQTGEFVVGGYTHGKGSRASLGALLIGYWSKEKAENKPGENPTGKRGEKDKLIYASHVGSGFDAKTLDLLQARLEPLQRKTWPFAEKPEPNGPTRPTIWVEPKMVVEVSFQNWTDDGALRAPVFVRLRDDVEAKKVRRPKPVSNESLRRRRPRDPSGTSSLSSTTRRTHSRWRSARIAFR